MAKVGDFVLAKGIGAWTLRLSKSGQRQGASDSLTISDKFVGMAVTNFCKKKSPGHNLSAVSPGLQRKRLNDLLGKLDVDAGYRWYSLRRGVPLTSFKQFAGGMRQRTLVFSQDCQDISMRRHGTVVRAEALGPQA